MQLEVRRSDLGRLELTPPSEETAPFELHLDLERLLGNWELEEKQFVHAPSVQTTVRPWDLALELHFEPQVEADHHELQPTAQERRLVVEEG